MNAISTPDRSAPASDTIPADPNTRLRRRDAARGLTAAGFPVSEATLATKAARGGGPPYQLFGRVPLYVWRDALAWAEGRLSTPRCSTSEGDLERRSNDRAA